MEDRKPTFEVPEVAALIEQLKEALIRVNNDQKIVTFVLYVDAMDEDGRSAAAFTADACNCESCLSKFLGIVDRFIDDATERDLCDPRHPMGDEDDGPADTPQQKLLN